ncbi:WD40 repeat domain-containing protein [Urbifossiella limnaea]|uniref:WD domain, G-beta repeat n=1 Tax=Urbifossiella limnaea TaxID=2528023 RepID=A0A517Y0H3_9BACT|nr:WD40 repeat domain-containing protein [Urbifossiella limnaea]QDU23208.1 WD domain, G-beta repeat [Urbifossiella limnaea]
MSLRLLLLGCLLIVTGCAGRTVPTEPVAAEPPDTAIESEPPESATLPHSNSVVGLAFTPDGGTLVTSDNDSIRLWDVASRRETATLKNGKSGAKPVAVSRDGKLIAAGNWDATVRLWDRATGMELATLTGHTGPVLTVAFSPDGSLLASGGRGKQWGGAAEVKLWNLRDRTEAGALPGVADPLGRLAFSPDGKTLAVGDVRGNLFLWDAASKKVTSPLKGQRSVSCVVWSPDGSRLVSGGSDLRVWEPATGKLLATLPVGDATDDCFGLAISRDGKLVASGTHRGNLKVWDLTTGTARLVLRRAHSPEAPVVRPIGELSKGTAGYVYCVALSPDDAVLAAGVGPTVRLWDLKTLLPANAAAEKQPKGAEPESR